jgi:uncharacterized membrane protein (UPF0127 family)
MAKSYYCIEKNEQVLLHNVRSASTFFGRLFGLMMKKNLGVDDGIYLSPCNQIHTFMMRFRIDAIFLSSENEVLHIENSMKPCKISRLVRGAAGVLETASGFASNVDIRVGDKVSFVKKR